MSAAVVRAAAIALLSACASPPSTELFAHPWPDERLRRPDGTLDLASFPRGTGASIRDQAIAALEDADGFGVASGAFFPFAEPLDPTSLPDPGDTGVDASVFVVAIEPDAPQYGRRVPIDARYLADGGPFGGTHLLAVLPYPGVPLAARTLYAAVVTTRVRLATGEPLPAIEADDPELDLDGAAIAAIARFRTGDPTAGLARALRSVLARPLPTLEPPHLVEEHEDYCVYASAIAMPDAQRGAAPYLGRGGDWEWTPEGELVVQRDAYARVVLTVPRVAAPIGGYPAAVFVRAGGGGDRPLVDRGPRDREGRSAPGSGLAREIALAGHLGASVDGPLGGARNTRGWDEQFVLFNVLNPVALRDNVRQSALELALFAHVLARLEIDASECAGASPRASIAADLALIGHSNGATIAPLAAAVEPSYRALILSGAGSSWIRQLVHKQSPAPTGPIASLLFGYAGFRQTFEHDPIVSLLQWAAGEPADPMVYAAALHDRDVLVFQGVVDTYIPPPIANPTALSLGLDLGGAPLDEGSPRSLSSELSWVGRGAVPLPVRANQGERTRVVVQHPADGIEDGHEVLFQQPLARAQLRCFLATRRTGATVVDEGCR